MLGVEPDWILCGNGSDDILTIVTRAFVGEGSLLRLPYPSYILYRTLAEIQGAKTDEVHFEPRLVARRPVCRDRIRGTAPRLAFLPNPNSPSGTVVPRRRVLELAERLPCPLLGRRSLRRLRRRRIAWRWSRRTKRSWSRAR